LPKAEGGNGAGTKAVFVAEFHWKRPGSRIGFGALPSPEIQQFPRDFIAAAIRAGAARLPFAASSETAAGAALQDKE